MVSVETRPSEIKIAEKAVCNPPLFDNMTLYFECRIDKNALFQTVFLAFLPTGYAL